MPSRKIDRIAFGVFNPEVLEGSFCSVLNGIDNPFRISVAGLGDHAVIGTHDDTTNFRPRVRAFTALLSAKSQPSQVVLLLFGCHGGVYEIRNCSAFDGSLG